MTGFAGDIENRTEDNSGSARDAQRMNEHFDGKTTETA